MRRFGLFAGWLFVVAIATTVTWQIVSAADNQVSDRPIAPLNVAAPVLTDSKTTTTTSAPATSITDSPTTVPTTPTTTGGSSGSSGSSTATTAAPATNATTATTATNWQSRSIQTGGGTVIVRFRPGEVQYQSATPAPGFQVEIEKAGPPEVRVEFESEEQKFEVEAHWEDGGLDVQTSSSSDD